MQPVTAKPLYIRMHADDNVAIVANDGGLHAGHRVPVRPAAGRAGPARPQGRARRHRRRRSHSPLRRGHRSRRSADRRAAAGSRNRWCRCPTRRRSTTCRSPNGGATPLPPLEGYTFEGYRNADGSVGTRNILAITTTCSASPAWSSSRSSASRPSCCRGIPTSTTWWPRAHLRLRRRDRRAGRRGPDPHAAQHQPAIPTSAAR